MRAKLAILVAALAWPTVVFAGNESARGSKPSTDQPGDQQAPAGAPSAPYTGPSVVVHSDRAPATTHDRRVDVGDMKISTPGAALASRHLASMQSEGYIEVPGNTIGPGEPLWVTRSLQNASVRLASAEADWLEAEVARTYRRNVHDRYGYGYFFYVLYAFEPWQTTRLAGYEPASPAAACGAHPTHPDTSHTKSSPAGDHVAPAVTVHKDTPATTMHDRRVDVGDMKISTPGPVTASGHPGTARLDRSVEVPINTIGAGVPLWVTRGLQDAEQRIAEAQAAWVEADAKRYYLR